MQERVAPPSRCTVQAQRDTTAEFRSRQACNVAQNPQQRHIVRDVELVFLAVDSQRYHSCPGVQRAVAIIQNSPLSQYRRIFRRLHEAALQHIDARQFSARMVARERGPEFWTHCTCRIRSTVALHAAGKGQTWLTPHVSGRFDVDPSHQTRPSNPQRVLGMPVTSFSGTIGACLGGV